MNSPRRGDHSTQDKLPIQWLNSRFQERQPSGENDEQQLDGQQLDGQQLDHSQQIDGQQIRRIP